MQINANPQTREHLNQLRMLLDANEVPRPHILWIYGRSLIPFMASIGRELHPKDGRIYPDQLYRYNVDTSRFRKVEPKV